jgi:hypothetical protein
MTSIFLRALVFVGTLTLACRSSAPEAQRPPLTPAPHGTAHADPALPFTLEAEVLSRGDHDAELRVRVTAHVALPQVTLGFSLAQELSTVDSTAQHTLPSLAAGATATHVTHVRRTTPGPFGVTVRAWVEARGEGVVMGDERALVLFGSAPTTQAPFVERIVPNGDGGSLHETVIP